MTNKENLNVSTAPVPPDRVFLEIGRLGLPLDSKENLICGLVIALAVALHIRLQNTLLGEGWFALIGFIGYTALRLWFLKRRYPEPGELLVESTSLTFPASVNFGRAETVEYVKFDHVHANIFKSRSGENLASIEFFCGLQHFKVNWLAVDLNKLEKLLLQHNLRVTRIYRNYVLLFFAILLLSVVILIAIHLLRIF